MAVRPLRCDNVVMMRLTWRSDFEMATKIAVDMDVKFGMSDAVGYVAYCNRDNCRGGGAASISDAQ